MFTESGVWMHHNIATPITVSSIRATVTGSTNEQYLLGKYELNNNGYWWNIDIPKKDFMQSNVFRVFGIAIGH